LIAKFVIGEVGAVLVPTPGAEMHLVDRDGCTPVVFPDAVFDPLTVAPLHPRQAVDYRGRSRRYFGAKTNGVGFWWKQFTTVTDDLVFIELSRTDIGHEDLPHADAWMEPHLVTAAVPTVEVAHDADAARIGRPHGEAGACHSVAGHRM